MDGWLGFLFFFYIVHVIKGFLKMLLLGGRYRGSGIVSLGIGGFLI